MRGYIINIICKPMNKKDEEICKRVMNKKDEKYVEHSYVWKLNNSKIITWTNNSSSLLNNFI